MSAILSFFKSRQFFVHAGLALASIILIFFFVIKWLSSYTHHGDYTQVPDFKGLGINTLDDFIKSKEVSYQIIDSIYDPKQKPGTVIRQDPEANSKVKHNRTVYLYVTGMVPPRISMPKLIDRSERQARLIIGTYGLKVGKVTEKSADCNGCVIAQMNKGSEIEPGEMINKGSTIDLVVGVKDSFYSGYTDTTKTEEPALNNDPE
jgi:eukaryotic-like serine/threonine-protein kinase